MQARPTHVRDERLGILVSVVILAATLSATISLPSQQFVLQLFGSELSLRFSGPVQVVLLLGLAVCSGVDALVRRAPTGQLRANAPIAYRTTFYSLPTTLTLIGLVAVHSVGWWGYQLAGAVGLGLMLAIVISMQLATHTLDTAGRRALRLLLNALAYALALGLYALVFGARLRSLLSGTGIMVVSGLIALELYRNNETNASRIWLYAGLTALLMGELTWALNYTALTAQVGSALLLLVFYTLTGIVQQSLWGRLDRRAMAEYGIVLAAGLIVIATLL